jgi:hypothetical protein
MNVLCTMYCMYCTIERWVAKLVARLLATAALWVRIQTSLKNTNWAKQRGAWPKHSSLPKNICIKMYVL